MLIGADSWFPPTQEIIDAVQKLHEFRFWGGYLNHWTRIDWYLLESNKLMPLPIWLPDYTREPILEVRRAVRTCKLFGMTGSITLDTTVNRKEFNTGWVQDFCLELNQISGWWAIERSIVPVSRTFYWLVKWGEHEEVPLPGEAISYGPYKLATSLNPLRYRDLIADAADDVFPFAKFRESVK